MGSYLPFTLPTFITSIRCFYGHLFAGTTLVAHVRCTEEPSVCLERCQLKC
jgi:hypothetical protein